MPISPQAEVMPEWMEGGDQFTIMHPHIYVHAGTPLWSNADISVQ